MRLPKPDFFCERALFYAHSVTLMVRMEALFHKICLYLQQQWRGPVLPSFLGPALTKGRFSLEFGFALHCDGCFVAVMGGVFFSLKASPGSLLHIEVSNMKGALYPKGSRVAVPRCLMLIMTITAKQFLVSLLLDDWEAIVGGVHGTVLWTCSVSAVAAGWEGRCGRRELFQGQAEQRFWHRCLLFSVHKDLLRCRWMQDWAVPLLGMGQGPRAESLLTDFPVFHSCGLSQLPTPVAGSRSRAVPGREAELRRELTKGCCKV